MWKLCGCECEGGAAACGSREQLCVHSGAVCALMVSRRCVTLGGCDCCVCNGCVCVCEQRGVTARVTAAEMECV